MGVGLAGAGGLGGGWTVGWGRWENARGESDAREAEEGQPLDSTTGGRHLRVQSMRRHRREPELIGQVKPELGVP